MLKYPPAMISIKPINKTKIEYLGLQAGLILIFPTKSTFSIELPTGTKITITKRQMALTALYSSLTTDCKVKLWDMLLSTWDSAEWYIKSI